MDKIICLGKNYLEHAEEMNEKIPEKPVIFCKPPSTLIEIDKLKSLKLAWDKGEIHHECEIVFKLYKKNLIAIGLGLDLTLRETQKKLKENGHPWEISKAFPKSALLTRLHATRDFPEWKTTPFEFYVNNELKQKSSMSEAILNPDQVIHHIDQYIQICDGDLIFTGTPKGVGKLKPGDEIRFSWGPIQKTLKLVEH